MGNIRNSYCLFKVNQLVIWASISVPLCMFNPDINHTYTLNRDGVKGRISTYSQGELKHNFLCTCKSNPSFY